MNQLKDEIESLHQLVKNYGESISKIKKYPSNTHYKRKIKKLFFDISQSLKKINRLIKGSFPRFEEVGVLIVRLINQDIGSIPKEKILEDIELKWQDLSLDLEDIAQVNNTYQIPKEIPFTDIRLDLEEAIQDYQNQCYLSAIVMCRRAYEGALISMFKKIEGKDPIKQIICKNCKNVVKGEVYFGIVELHKWAVDKKIISDKFRDIGFLVPNLGSGGAHPTDSFPRDKEVANIVIITSIALLKQIYSKKI